MISCILIDDEPLAIQSLEGLIDRYFNESVKVLATSGSLKEGVFAIYKHHPDLVFLDIEMPGENGFHLFEYFKEIDFSVIFTTAYQHYAIEAIKFAALDYLLKPVNFIELRDTLKRYEKIDSRSVPMKKIEQLIHSIQPSVLPQEKIALPTLQGFQMERINSILYCEADQNYTRIFTIRGDNLLVSRPLSAIEEMLSGKSFFRIHKSYLVNMNYIKSYSRSDGYHVVLENGVSLDVATRRNEEFLKALTHFE